MTKVKQKKFEERMSKSQQELSHVKKEIEDVLEHSKDLQRKLEEKEGEAEQHKKEKLIINRNNELEIIGRNMQDINRLSQQFEKIDKVYGRIALLFILFFYLLVIISVALIIWKLGLGGHIEFLKTKITSESKIWEIFVTLLPELISVIWLVLMISVPFIFSFVKGKGFIINPQSAWQIIKNDLSYSKVKKEVAGYEWFYEKVGKEPGLKELYYENGDGISNIKHYIKEIRSELNVQKQELDMILVACQ